MNFEEMTIAEIKTFLDENGVDYTGLRKKEDLIELAQNVPVDSETESDVEELVESDNEPEVKEKPQGLVNTIKSALKVEKTVTKTVDKYSYLDGRDYQQLDTAEREIVRHRSPEYESKTSGVQVKVTDLLITKHQVAKTADRKWRRFFKGQTYIMSQEDFDVLKNEIVKVKISGTCCGNAKYDKVPLLEVVNG